MIVSSVLRTCVLTKIETLKGENRVWSLLGLKGLNHAADKTPYLGVLTVFQPDVVLEVI